MTTMVYVPACAEEDTETDIVELVPDEDGTTDESL
jgi:hypothetical protein